MRFRGVKSIDQGYFMLIIDSIKTNYSQVEFVADI